MVFKVSEDKKFLVLVDSTELELKQLEYSFTKKVNNWYIIKKKKPDMTWDGEVQFIDRYNRIPIGLWKEVQKLAKQYHFPLEIEGIEHLYDKNFDVNHFNMWLDEHFRNSDKKPRDYQAEASSQLLKFRFCTEEISTSGGKTLIAYTFFRYLYQHDKIKKMLYIVPNVSLVTQSEEEFYEYEDGCGFRPKWKTDCAFGGRKDTEANTNIIFGTFQTLAKKDLEYFKDFDAVIVDETHHAKAKSIKDIIVKCYNAKYRIGLTGTLPKDGTCDSFTIQAYLGPQVYNLESAKLISDGHATPVLVYGVELDYLSDEVKKKLYDLRNVPAEQKDGAKLLNLEKDIARDSRERFNYIVDTISKVKKNSLVLFSDVKNDYGRRIYDWLRANTTKKAYYIDGGTKSENRDYYKSQMEDEKDVIIVASVGTFSEGINIHNLHNIFVVESYKSQFIIRQILGRGMRLLDGKEKIIVIDFSDDFCYGSGWHKTNYLMKHANEREKIYKEKKFPFKKFKVKL